MLYIYIYIVPGRTSACTLAFFGMLRSSEYTSPNNTTFLSNSTLQVTDISFSPDLSFVSILIKHSKTDPFRHGCTIRLAAVSSDLCPVAALLRYLRYRHYSVGPLFVFQSGIYLTHHHIVTLLRDALPHVSNINTHSFRIGGASAASSAGIPDSLIQVMGRWSSDAYHRYLRVSDVTVRDVSVRMSNSSVLHRFWDSDTVSSKLLGWILLYILYLVFLSLVGQRFACRFGEIWGMLARLLCFWSPPLSVSILVTIDPNFQHGPWSTCCVGPWYGQSRFHVLDPW